MSPKQPVESGQERSDTRPGRSFDRAVQSLGVVAWFVAGEILGRFLGAWIYGLEGVAEVERLREQSSLADFQFECLQVFRWIGVSAVLFLALRWWLESRRHREILARLPSPGRVAFVRLWICLVCALLVAWEDLASAAFLPPEMLRSMGLMDLLRLVPGVETFAASPPALAALKWATVAALVLAACGWRTRWTLPAATIGYFIVQGWLRQYFRFYHVGIVPGYLLIALWAGLSTGRSNAEPSAKVRARWDSAWVIWTCWLVLALTYLEAGLMKVRRGGLSWWSPENMRRIVLRDNLNPMEFDFDFWEALWACPDWVFTLLGIATVVIEVAFPLVLVSKRARLVLPLAAAALHGGIWALQNVLFPDLILLQAIVLAAAFWPDRPVEEGADDRLDSHPPPPGFAAGRRKAVWIGGVMLFAFALRLEFYPLTAMQMYSRNDRSGVAEWLELEADTGRGETIELVPEALIPAARDGRYRWTFLRAFDRPDRSPAEAFARSLARRFEALHDVELKEVRARRCLWNFRTENAAEARADRILIWRADEPRASALEADGRPCAVR